MLRRNLLKHSMALGAAGALAPTVAFGQNTEMRERVNSHVVGIMAGRPGSTDLDLAYDLDQALSDGYDLRIIPMVSKGSAGEIEDLLYLRGVDLAIAQSDVIEFMEVNRIYPGLKSSVRAIAPLGLDQVHILARPEFDSIYALANRKVNFSNPESGSSMTANVIFGALGLPVEVTTHEHHIALEYLRKGEIDAMIRASAAPNSLFEEVRQEENLRFVPIPTSDELGNVYGPTELTSEHYPALIPAGQVVQTAGVVTILVSYNWERGSGRGGNLASFCDRFVRDYANLLQEGFHESWQSIDIAQSVPGLERHWAMEDALRKNGRV